MMVDTGAPSAVAERVRELCRQFKLPTLAAETVGRFSARPVMPMLSRPWWR